MVDAALRKALRDAHYMEEVNPPDVLRMQRALEQVIDQTGALNRDVIRPFLPPFRYRFHVPGTLAVGNVGGMDRVARAGTLTRISAHAGTAPSSTCIVQLRDASANVLATVTIAAGETTGDSEGLGVGLLAGQWIGINVVETGGAGDLSVVATEQVG